MKTKVLLSTLTLSLLLASCGPPSAPQISPDADLSYTDQSSIPGSDYNDLTYLVPGPNPNKLPSRARLGEATIAKGTRLNAQALPANAQTDKVELRVLVLSSGAGDYGLDSATAMLQQSGVPYVVLDASQAPLGQGNLINADGSGKYQGVILTTNALINETSPGVYTSTLDSSEWDTLFQYEAAYKVRQLALYGYPGVSPEDYGLRAVPGAETATTSMAPNTAGRGVFKDLTGAALPVQYAYSYPASVEAVSGVITTPLLLDPQGLVLAATSTAADGRERLLITTAENPYLLHTELMGYGLVQWLTRGVHLGEHRRFLQVDIDDYFLDGDHLNAQTGQLYPTPFRLSGSDMLSLRDQQTSLEQAFPVARAFRYAMVFNGGGANTNAPASCNLGISTPDLLTSVTKCVKGSFDWVNHTRNHLRMDVMDLKTAKGQIGGNVTIANKLGLPFSQKSLVTGEHSGLGNMDPNDDGTHNDDDTNPVKQDLGLGRSNPNMLSAAVNAGVRFIASDHSVASQRDDSCATCGVPHPLKSNIFLVPRWPTNMHYHVTTPDEALRSYNSIYAPGGTRPYWDHALNYAEFLDKDSDLTLNHILGGYAFPHYMHQPNLAQYAPGKSLISDWARAALTKYSQYSTLPLNTYKWDDLGTYMQRHTTEEKAKTAGTLRGVWDRKNNRVVLSNLASGTAPLNLTGATSGTVYGAYRIASLNLSGNKTVAVTPQ
ncbi:Agd3-related carbohydrate-binding protein [Deinococcus marmoris]|uniref:Lipoprotein n=1 Tax=Deinococcus marmoris TaxID=249408 RepID=A0A1U7NZ91_9DEIO|nr:hypothetical protein [Deinococcus marmoris]OLV18235.1 hypothetical protein BOO71_0006409 [Deinococcus marmoris]